MAAIQYAVAITEKQPTEQTQDQHCNQSIPWDLRGGRDDTWR